ncbi:hypothetical protein NC981_09235 [Leptolyngbya sp. DQ-M1]|uniref:hypothetical protein n=1 Tax=Leptolyngbya sp. DQ-M1 TaxID=2933920 RepID=UPI0032979C9D
MLKQQNNPKISDTLLDQIVNAVSLSGEHEIAKLTMTIKTLRSFKQGLAVSDLALWYASEEYDQALCLSLYRALQQVYAMSSAGGVDVSVLHRLWKGKHSPLLDSGTRLSEP